MALGRKRKNEYSHAPKTTVYMLAALLAVLVSHNSTGAATAEKSPPSERRKLSEKRHARSRYTPQGHHTLNSPGRRE
jgi:hypothetical protein